jgi:hypothetical protein
MALRIRCTTGPRAGTVQELPDAVMTIAIGRNPATCQVVAADPGDARIGREHCTLQRYGGRYRLAIPESHRVFVDGEAAFDGDELPTRAMLRLGVAGGTPIELAVETLDTGRPAMAAQGVLRSGVRTALGPVEAPRRWSLGVVVAALAALGVLALVVVRLRS